MANGAMNSKVEKIKRQIQHFQNQMRYCFAQDRYSVYCYIRKCMCYTARLLGALIEILVVLELQAR